MYRPKTNRRDQKFCSYGCTYEYTVSKARIILAKRLCGNCSGEFMPTRAFQIYCTTACKAKHHKEAWTVGVSAHELRNLPEKMSEEEMQEGIATLKPPPGFTHQDPVPSTTIKASVPKEIDIPTDDTPEDEKPICVRCGVNRTVTLVDIHCKECYLKVEKEELK